MAPFNHLKRSMITWLFLFGSCSFLPSDSTADGQLHECSPLTVGGANGQSETQTGTQLTWSVTCRAIYYPWMHNTKTNNASNPKPPLPFHLNHTESFLLHTLKMFRFTLLDPPWPFCFVLFPHCIFIMWLWQRDPIGSFDAVTHTLMLTQSVAQEVQEKTCRTRKPAGGPAAVIIINN